MRPGSRLYRMADGLMHQRNRCSGGARRDGIGVCRRITRLWSRPDPITNVEILNPFSYQEFADDKLIVLDIRGRDSHGRLLNIEMQVSLGAGLLQRLTYYSCRMYVQQLESGQNDALLQPAILICLLSKTLFGDSGQPHHRFQLLDSASGRELPRGVEVHNRGVVKV